MDLAAASWFEIVCAMGKGVKAAVMIKCPYAGCSFEDPTQVLLHLKEFHRISAREIAQLIPEGEHLWVDEIEPPFAGTRVPRREQDLILSFCGVKAQVHLGVSEESCLPLPKHWKMPTRGRIADAMRRATISLKNSLPVFIQGPAGTGKDAFFHAWSHFTRQPAEIYSIAPDADIGAWLFSRELTKDGTSWSYGRLWKQLTEGFVLPSGARIPFLIILSDIDRAAPSQVEYLRMILDTIEGRVKSPDGGTVSILPGTIIAATANSMGASDSRGAYISARPMDASILSRFGVKIHFPYWDWEDEAQILQATSPDVMADRTMSSLIQKVRDAIRDEIKQGRIMAEFGLRELISWVRFISILLKEGMNLSRATASFALLNILDGLPDQANQQVLISRLAKDLPDLAALSKDKK
jgi:MoxR-like ATPase